MFKLKKKKNLKKGLKKYITMRIKVLCLSLNTSFFFIETEDRRSKKLREVDDAESDDSMASGASSGQIHYHHSQSQGSKCSLQKNASKQEKKKKKMKF